MKEKEYKETFYISFIVGLTSAVTFYVITQIVEILKKPIFEVPWFVLVIIIFLILLISYIPIYGMGKKFLVDE